MKQISGLAMLLGRLLVTSTLALVSQVVLVVKSPDLLLVIQEAVKAGSIRFFEYTGITSGYRVAYNLLNGDGIVVHILFVLAMFFLLYVVFIPFRVLRPARAL